MGATLFVEGVASVTCHLLCSPLRGLRDHLRGSVMKTLGLASLNLTYTAVIVGGLNYYTIAVLRPTQFVRGIEANNHKTCGN